MRNILIYFFLILLTPCSSKSKIAESKIALNQFLNTVSPYGTIITTSEDTLVFGFSKSSVGDDTSWTLLISKSQGGLRCHFNQLLPYTITGFDGYLDDSSRLLYYEGFSFDLDGSKWEKFVNLSSIDTYVIQDNIHYTGCLHCPRYSAYYNSKLIVSSKRDTEFLISLDSLLHRIIIDYLFDKKRHPIMEFKK